MKMKLGSQLMEIHRQSTPEEFFVPQSQRRAICCASSITRMALPPQIFRMSGSESFCSRVR